MRLVTKILYVFCIISLYTYTENQAQIAPSKVWDRTFGGSGNDETRDIIQLSDGNFLLGGYSSSSKSGDKSDITRSGLDYWIVKVDSSGDKIWDKTFGGNEIDALHDLLALPDGGALLGGESYSGISGDKSEPNQGAIDSGSSDFWIVKVSKNGDKVWDKTYGGNGVDQLWDMVVLPDGNFLIGGTSSSDTSGDKSEDSKGSNDYWIIKIDAQGDIIWDKTLGANSGEHLLRILVLPDGSIFLGGTSDSNASGDKSEDSNGASDYWVIKLDADGNKIWDKAYGGDLNDITLFGDMIALSDGGFLLGGHSYSGISGDKSEDNRGGSDYWVVKVDAEGNKIWDKTLGGDATDWLTCLIELPGNEYLVGGLSLSGISGDKNKKNNGSASGIWLVKIDSEGNKVWERVLGGDVGELLINMIDLPDGSLILGGASNSNVAGDKTEPSKGGTDYWILKLAPSALVLVNSDEDSDVQILDQGDVVDLSEQISNRLSIRYEPQAEIGSVKMELSGGRTRLQTENLAPYALYGGTSTDYFGLEFCPGVYTIKATPYTGSNLTGDAGEPLEISFTLDGSALFMDELVLVDAGSNTDLGLLKEGATITLPIGGISIRADNNDNCEGSVKFILKDTDGQTVFSQTESSAPYAIQGDNHGDYNAWTPAPGDYTLEITPYSGFSASGLEGNTLIRNFSIMTSEENVATTLNIYPNPNPQDVIHLRLNIDLVSQAEVAIFDKQGNQLKHEMMDSNQKIINIKDLEPGFYILKVQSEFETFQKSFIKK